MSRNTTGDGSTIDRRTVLQAVGGATAVGLAGCTGGDGDAEDLGERVESVQMEYWSDYGGFTTTQEQMAPVISRGIEELGAEVDVVPVDISTQLGQMAADENRDNNITFGWWVPTADRIDPQELLSNLRIDWCGANGRSNYWNWADCEYTERVLEQERAETEEEREELLHQAIERMAEQLPCGDLCPVANIGAWRTDMVEVEGIGQAGMARSNAEWAFKSQLIADDEDTLIIGTDPIATETTNFPTHHASMPEAQWQHMIHSPVHKYNEDYELTPMLGEVEVVDAQEVVVELFDDAAFSNGDPITSEDVKFTFEQVRRGADVGAYPGALPVPYDSIEAVDEQTVQFTFTEPYIPFVNTTLMRWGIWHSESFIEAGAEDAPADVTLDLPIPTSGPLGVVDMDTGERVICEPNDGHPTYQVEQDVIFEAFRNEETMLTALEAGECHIAPEISPPNAERVREEMDDARAEFRGTHTTYLLQYVCHIPPYKFEEFRKATSMALNRREMIAIAFDGEVEPEMYGTYISQHHPMYPDEDRLYAQAEDPEGEPDRARQMLEDAGWGWDGDGNLHYPEDADLDPLWPQGEVPSADDFPCIDEYEEIDP